MSYKRRQFQFTLPIREIRPEDATQPFENEFHFIESEALASLIPINIEDRYIVVFDYNDKILAFLEFLDKTDHFHLDLVETNRLHSESKFVKPGVHLIVFIETLSKTLKFAHITLDSTTVNIPLYAGLGYLQSGDKWITEEYGELTPMTKILS
jgi:hypothetical protein